MRQTPLKTSLAAALVAVSLLAGTSAWALEYEEPRTQDERSRVIDRLIAERDYQKSLKSAWKSILPMRNLNLSAQSFTLVSDTLSVPGCSLKT